jgi:hypothetical protein
MCASRCVECSSDISTVSTAAVIEAAVTVVEGEKEEEEEDDDDDEVEEPPAKECELSVIVMRDDNGNECRSLPRYNMNSDLVLPSSLLLTA